MNRIKAIAFLMIIFSFGNVRVYPESISENYELVADVFDEMGGASQSNNFKIRISSGGQPSPIGEEVSTNFKMRGGYVYSLSVLHGDANADGSINGADVAWLTNYLFVGGPEPIPWETGDANGDRMVNSSDIAYLVNYLFVGGPPPGDSPE